MHKLLPVFATTFLLAACNQPQKTNNNEGLDLLSVDTLSATIQQLASDDFMGRKPFTEGETKTVAYLENRFRQMGLAPGNGNSYIQEVPMVSITAQADPKMDIQSARGNMQLKAPDDYVIWTDRVDSGQSFSDDELVFAGYGVVAPEYNWNDYAGIDVRGKVVMVLVNDPGFNAGDTSLFKGKSMTYYGRWTYKFEEAARQGAKGCLVIHNTLAAGYPFNVQQSNFNTSRLRLDSRGTNEKLCNIIGWITQDAVKRLITFSGKDTAMIVQSDKSGFKAVPLGLKASTSMRINTVYNKSRNVIAKVTGSKYPDEYIIYTAHWDHFGIGKPDNTGDSIYNGALDNASGTAAVLELARAFKNTSTPPERTIVFLAVTAEEQGLWGSAYYVQHPVYPLEKTVANINIDGVNKNGRSKDIVVVGKQQSELEDVLKSVLDQQGRYLSFEPHPEAGYYFRSDHFNFAKAGVPALYTESGSDIEGKGIKEGERLQDEYTSKYYHQPSDQFDSSWDLKGSITDLQMFFLVGKKLAFGHTWPGWKQGSEFKMLRDRTNNVRE
ncbi:MAG TPA: M28 family metallopeptidase [Flavitalea sp.]|nr:M28 family metallopeptidase [Flavitalea sp.]